MKRLYSDIIAKHINHDHQMLFLTGPRQVGKTTAALMAKDLTDNLLYLNWDNMDHRKIIVQGSAHVAAQAGLEKLVSNKPIIVFDELHKYSKWKTFLKGFYDTYKESVHIIVTGSARLDVYKRGGDSLMGRYFPYRIHPLSLAELYRPKLSSQEIQPPIKVSQTALRKLFRTGGFPEPYLKQDRRFCNRWIRLRHDQLFREDIRDLSRVQEIGQLELMAELIRHQAGQLTSYSNLANKVNVSVDTVRRWLTLLQSMFYCFTIQPWSRNVSRSLLKEPKLYLWDWANVSDLGSRLENMIASHLLKAVHYWTDAGFGKYDLWFLRDKEKQEVDFLVSRDQQPWFLAEVKSSSKQALSSRLTYFQKKTGAKHAFQVVLDMPFVSKNCFHYHNPVIVPAATFLSQLV